MKFKINLDILVVIGFAFLMYQAEYQSAFLMFCLGALLFGVNQYIEWHQKKNKTQENIIL